VKDIAPSRGHADKLASCARRSRRCKEILASLSAAAGQVRAESGQSLALDAWLRELVDKWLALRPVSARVSVRRTQRRRTWSRADPGAGDHQHLNNAADARRTM